MEIDPVLRASYPKALATLIRLLGDFDTAEEALQEAVTRALEVWPSGRVPDEPAAWLVTTARRRHIDVLRHRRVEKQHAEARRRLAADVDSASGEANAAGPFEDDMMRLICTCCHPALSREARTALTLRTVAGLTVEEIARAFLVPARTVEQRITRAKRKIRDARIPYEIPGGEELAKRQAAVLEVIYLLFNEGYVSTRGPELVRPDLCREAIRLGRVLVRLFPSEPEALGLLALMLLQDARRPARIDARGSFVPLDEQDRSLWNGSMIAEGRVLLEKARHHGKRGPCQVQAAIALRHSMARDAAETDWGEILRLYDELEAMQPSPVVRLNRAAALAKARGPDVALRLLDELAGSPVLHGYPYFYSTRAALLAELSRKEEAAAMYREAIRRTANPVEREHLRGKLAALR